MSEPCIADGKPWWPDLDYGVARRLFWRLESWLQENSGRAYPLTRNEAELAVLPLLEEYLRWHRPEDGSE